jgi:ATP-dependent Clp protease ATP-binding subunit ClpA
MRGLSSVLRGKGAVQVNIEIMRAFVRVREILGTHRELAGKLKELENRIQDHDEQIQAVFEAIRQVMTPPEKPRKPIGFEVKKGRAGYGKRAKGKMS